MTQPLMAAAPLPYECDAEELERLRRLDEGRRQHASGSEPWLVDGEAWHLYHLASDKTRPMAEALIRLVAEAAPDMAPKWAQKTYVVWQVGRRNWLTLWCRASYLWLGVHDAQFTVEEAADQLGFRLVDTPSFAGTGPSQVQRATSRGRTWIMFRNPDDFAGASGAALHQLLREAHAEFAAALGQGKSGDRPWLVDGREWHLSQRCSLKTRPIMESLLTIVDAVAPPDGGPHWNKYYVGYDAGSRLWVSLKPWAAWVWLRLHGSMLSSQTVAERLNFEYVPSGEEPRWTSEGPSLVMPAKRLRGLRIMLRNEDDVTGATAAAMEDVLRMSLQAATTEQLAPSVEEDDDDEEDSDGPPAVVEDEDPVTTPL
jgi:hypothetical protein